MAKIYIVTCGSYSDYTILAAFTSHYQAEKYVQFYNECDVWDKADIEEYEEGSTPEVRYYQVISKNNSIEVESIHHEFTKPDNLKQVVEHKTIALANESIPSIYYEVFLSAKDAFYAKKIAGDLFREYKALH